jgi:8-oxo-dGTP pyrophosphatase MutT (NUDIX family)
MDAKDASPEMSGERELREETGYEGTNARVIGSVWANPAIMSNICHTILIENCRCVHPLEWDHTEELVTKLVPVSEVPGLVASGKIRHSLVVVALYHFELLQRGGKKI